MAANPNRVSQWKEYTAREDAKLGTIQKGVWNRVVLNFKTSYNSDGFYRVYINGNMDFNYEGPIFFNDEAGPYIKFGLYKPSWKPRAIEEGWGGVYDGIARRTYYQDDLKIFKGSDGFNSVSTTCGAASMMSEPMFPPLPPTSIDINIL